MSAGKMSRLLKENLLRSFFSLSAEAGIKLSQGRVEGIILRRNLIRALSDIALADTSPIPLEPAPHADAVLEILEKYGIERDGRSVLPVFDSTYALQHFWGRAEIIKAFEAIPTITTWQPPKVERSATMQEAESSERPVRARLYDLFVPPPEKQNVSNTELQNNAGDVLNTSVREAPEKTKKTIEIKINRKAPESNPSQSQVEPTEINENIPLAQKTTEAPQQKNSRPAEPVAEIPVRNKIKDDKDDKKFLRRFKVELEHGKLAILALEALGLPLLAIDTEGNEFFHNQEWGDLLARYGSRFEPAEIRVRAQDIIAQRALQGNLDVHDTLELPGLLRGKTFYLRAIRTGGTINRTIGYIIWAENSRPSPAAAASMPATGSSQEATPRNYLGRTLTEILAEEEKKALFWAYEQADGNQSNAAMLLGIPRQTYAYRLRKFLRGDRKAEQRIKERQHGATADYEDEPPKNQDIK